MNAVGIDVSKGKSTVAIMQPLGVVVKTPYAAYKRLPLEGKLSAARRLMRCPPHCGGGAARIVLYGAFAPTPHPSRLRRATFPLTGRQMNRLYLTAAS